jgi:uncharacterized protein (DUF2236 family)
MVFGTQAEAAEAARQINTVHRRAVGIDAVTGQRYSAQDPDLLLWVHACLTSSFLLFERLTVGRLDDRGRQRFHDEAKATFALLGLPPKKVPASVAELDGYIRRMCASGTLRLTEGSRAIPELMGGGSGLTGRARSRVARFLAFQTLPPELRAMYGVPHGPREQRRLTLLCTAIRSTRPLLPARLRLIGPAMAARQRSRGVPARVSTTPVLPAQRRRDRHDDRQPA